MKMNMLLLHTIVCVRFMNTMLRPKLKRSEMVCSTYIKFQKQTKLIHAVRNQNSAYLWGKVVSEGTK